MRNDSTEHDSCLFGFPESYLNFVQFGKEGGMLPVQIYTEEKSFYDYLFYLKQTEWIPSSIISSTLSHLV